MPAVTLAVTLCKCGFFIKIIHAETTFLRTAHFFAPIAALILTVTVMITAAAKLTVIILAVFVAVFLFGEFIFVAKAEIIVLLVLIVLFGRLKFIVFTALFRRGFF